MNKMTVLALQSVTHTWSSKKPTGLHSTYGTYAKNYRMGFYNSMYINHFIATVYIKTSCIDVIMKRDSKGTKQAQTL